MARAIRRVVGAIKKWGRRYIAECGGQQAITEGRRSPLVLFTKQNLRLLLFFKKPLQTLHTIGQPTETWLEAH